MKTADDLSILREKSFSEAVEKLDNLVLQSDSVFLIGAGCSKCAGLPLIVELTNLVLSSDALDKTSKAVLNEIKTLFEGSKSAHIEIYLSELIDLLAIVERRNECGASNSKVTLGAVDYTATNLRNAVNQIKRAIASVIEKKVSLETHQDFVKSVHRPVRVGKLSNKIVDYIVLNYDTAIEDALALERILYADGIDGGSTGWWNDQSFDREGLAARVLKLHGSIDWCEFPSDPLPRRVGSCCQIKDVDDDRRILIWPASTKYRETQLDPYAQLANRARRILRPGLSSQRVLVICGYSFGDAHINIEIDRAVRESARNLTIVALTNEDEPTGQLKTWNEDVAIREQVLIYSNRGFYHGDHSVKSTTDLLWWKFENFTRLLRGER